MDVFTPATTFAYPPTLLRLALALGLIMVLGLGATFVPVSAVRSVAAGG